MLKPIIDSKLAYPCGIAMSLDESVLFVAETGLNRVLRIACHASGAYYTSVFH
jgi:sugar lactone lactonase YvrE